MRWLSGGGSSTAPTPAKPFLPYLTDEVTKVVTGQSDHLSSKEVVEPTNVSPPPWQVCAPGNTALHYDIVIRPGVIVKVGNRTKGCVKITVTLPKSYRPAQPKLRQCVVPWGYLNDVTKAALSTSVDVKALIQKQIPVLLRARVDG